MLAVILVVLEVFLEGRLVHADVVLPGGALLTSNPWLFFIVLLGNTADAADDLFFRFFFLDDLLSLLPTFLWCLDLIKLVKCLVLTFGRTDGASRFCFTCKED